MDNNSTNNTDATRPRQDVALVETENTGASGDRPSVVIGEGEPSSRVDNTTPLPGEETGSGGFAATANNNAQSSNTSTSSQNNTTDNPSQSNNTEEKTEQPASNGSVAAQYVVCKGATCKCDQGKAMGKLTVTTHKKYYINDDGNDKLIATVDDIIFEQSPAAFGSCNLKNNNACALSATQWVVPNNSRFPDVGGKNILTEKGTLNCTVGGKIEFVTHGQTVTVNGEDVRGAKEAFADMEQINALLVYEDTGDTSVKGYVTQVETISLSNQNELRTGAIEDGGNKSLYVLVNDELKFAATTTRGQTDHYISWSVSESIDNSNILASGKSGNKIVVNTTPENTKYIEKKTTSRYYSVYPLRVGTYIVSAASKSKSTAKKTYHKDFYYYIEAVDQASIIGIKCSNGDQNVIKGQEITVSVHSNLKLTEAECRAVSIEVYMLDGTAETHLYSYRDSSIESVAGSMRFTQSNNVLEAKVKLNNIGKYKVKVFKDTEELTAYSKVIETVDNEVIQIEQVPDVIRRGGVLSFTAKLKNEQQINESQIRWRLMLPNGRTYGEEKTGKTAPFTFSDVGTYTIQCIYGSRLFLSQEKVQGSITVKANQIENMSVPKNEALEGGKVYKVYIKSKIKLHLDLLFNYEYEVASGSSTASAFAVHNTKAKALEVDIYRPSKKDSVLVWSVAYAGAKAAEDGIKLSIENKQLRFEKGPVYFTTTRSELDIELNEMGKYVFTAQLGSGQSRVVVLDCVYGEITQWMFHDGEKKITQLSFKEDFHYSIKVDGWANKKGKLNIWWDNKSDGGTLLKYIKSDDTIEKGRHHLIYTEEVTFGSNGAINRKIASDSEFWTKLVEIVEKERSWTEKDYHLYFTVSDIDVLCNNHNDRVYQSSYRNKHTFPNNDKAEGSYAVLGSELKYEMSFVDTNVNKSTAVIEYGAFAFIQLKLHRAYNDVVKPEEEYDLVLYENLPKRDREVSRLTIKARGTKKTSERFSIKSVNSELECDLLSLPYLLVKYDTNRAEFKKDRHLLEKVHGYSPRLFYAVLYTKSGREICMYPKEIGIGSKNDNMLDMSVQMEDESEENVKKQVALDIALANKKKDEQTSLLGQSIQNRDPKADQDALKAEVEKTMKEIERLESDAYYQEKLKEAKATNDNILKKDRKSKTNYYEQLKIALKPIFNDALDRNKAPVKVQEGGNIQNTSSTNKVGCPNCRDKVTLDILKIIFPDATTDTLQDVASAYNKYMEYFSLDTCRKKAYFFAAASVEAGTSILGKFGTTEENMNYSRLNLLRNFPAGFFAGSWKKPEFKTGWTSTVYSKKPTDTNYQEHGWYATVDRGNTTLYIQIEDQTKGNQNRVFKSQNYWQRVIDIQNANDQTNEKSILVARYAYWYKNGNDTEDDGENYRGSGLVQLTGKEVYSNVQEVIKNIMDKSVVTSITTKAGAELVRTNLEVGTLGSMGYFAMKKLNAIINEFPRNGENDTDAEALEVWGAIGLNIGEDENGKESSFTKKTKAYKNKAKSAFKVPECIAHKSITPSAVSDVEIITYEINYKSIGSVKKGSKDLDLYIKKIVPKEGNNKSPNYCKYVYIDKSNKRHEICVLKFKTIKEIYFDSDKKIQVSTDKRVDMIDYVMDFKGYESSDGSLSVGFNRDATKTDRRYAVDIDCFAAILGAMCDENIDCISFNGASNFRGYPSPSKLHVNGRVFDVGYIPKNGKVHQAPLLLQDANFDFERQKLFNEALYKYGFARDMKMYSEDFIPNGKVKKEGLPHCIHYDKVRHNNHLHIQGFNRGESIIDEQRQ